MLAWKFWPGHQASRFDNELSGKTELPEDSPQTDAAGTCRMTRKHLTLKGGEERVQN